MLHIDLCSIISIIVCAQITDSKVYILRDYDDEPIYIDAEDRGLHNENHSLKHKPLPSSGYKRKRAKNPKQATLHYGRHIYHLDSFDDLTKLRSQLDPDYISYDYFDINDLYRSSDSMRSIPWDYVQNLLILAPRPIFNNACKGDQCDDNLRKYNALYKLKHGKNIEDNVKGKKLHGRQSTLRHLNRFKIINNSKNSKSKAARQKNNIDSSEEYHEKRKSKHNKKKYSTESASSSKESKETKEWSASNSESEENIKKKKYKKKKYVHDSSSSKESTEYQFQKKKKKHGVDRDSYSLETNLKYDSNSIEDNWQKKKKKKKKNYSSDEKQKRKTFESGEMILQGNNMYDKHGLTDSAEDDRRRRLPQFLPKRYHWDPSDINQLGYYWFNGPKGKFPSPTPIARRKI